jgi:hypothetical protein
VDRPKRPQGLLRDSLVRFIGWPLPTGGSAKPLSASPGGPSSGTVMGQSIDHRCRPRPQVAFWPLGPILEIALPEKPGRAGREEAQFANASGAARGLRKVAAFAQPKGHRWMRHTVCRVNLNEGSLAPFIELWVGHLGGIRRLAGKRSCFDFIEVT